MEFLNTQSILTRLAIIYKWLQSALKYSHVRKSNEIPFYSHWSVKEGVGVNKCQ